MAMNRFVIVLLAAVANAMSLAPGAKVLVVGNGPIQCLAARLCAIKGYTTTLAVIGTTMSTDEQVVCTDADAFNGAIVLAGAAAE